MLGISAIGGLCCLHRLYSCIPGEGGRAAKEKSQSQQPALRPSKLCGGSWGQPRGRGVKGRAGRGTAAMSAPAAQEASPYMALQLPQREQPVLPKHQLRTRQGSPRCYAPQQGEAANARRASGPGLLWLPTAIPSIYRAHPELGSTSREPAPSHPPHSLQARPAR